jgi:hypothetical protein
MRRAPLAWLPPLGAAVALALAAAGPRAVLVAEAAAHALALAGCVAAAAALGRRDWLFRAWALYAFSHALPVGRRLFLGESFWTAEPLGPGIHTAYMVAANGARVAGSVLFVLAFARAGLASGTPPRRGVHAAALALGIAVGIPTLVGYVDATLAEGAPWLALRGAIAIAADTACFVLVAPLVRIAGAFRGGALAAPWAFLACANAGWLAYDASRAAARVLGLGDWARSASGAFIVAACLCALAAGLSHRSAIASAEGAPSARAA